MCDRPSGLDQPKVKRDADVPGGRLLAARHRIDVRRKENCIYRRPNS